MVLLIVAACGAGGETASEAEEEATPVSTATPTPGPLEPSGPFMTDTVTLRSPDGERVEVPVYVADEPSLRQRGLMHTDELKSDAGMVFRFRDDSTSGFHMENTRMPLSIAFADAEGEIQVILDMEPCESAPCESYEPNVQYRTALEVNQGFFDSHDVEPGWTLHDPGS